MSAKNTPAIPLGRRRMGAGWPACVLVLVLSGATARAHDVPQGMTVHAFVKPEGQHLQLLVRFPLAALADVDFPQRGPGYLDLARMEPWLRSAAEQWLTAYGTVYEGGRPLERPDILSVRISLPGDHAFSDYPSALSHLTRAPLLPAETNLMLREALLDVRYEFSIRSDRSDFSLVTHLERLGLNVTSVIRFLAPAGGVRAFEFDGNPGMVRLDPRWHQAALGFVRLGFLHILDGTDHLLFLLCLVIPFRRPGRLIAVISAFTLAHSITLIAATYDVVPQALWFPFVVEALIAGSIVYMALENIVAPQIERRWVMAFGFGLVHGFGFSRALRETMQFAGSHLLTSLLSFNLGVELGQLLVLALVIPLLTALFRHVVAERMGTIILSALVAHTGWHWLIDRADRLRQVPFAWPAVDLEMATAAIQWLTLLVLAAIGLWTISWFASGAAARPKGPPLSETFPDEAVRPG